MATADILTDHWFLFGGGAMLVGRHSQISLTLSTPSKHAGVRAAQTQAKTPPQHRGHEAADALRANAA